MSYDPFDGVLLDDARAPVSGAFGMLLHLRVARRMAKGHGWFPPRFDSLKSRAQACQELLAQGLFPAALRELRSHGLDLGNPKSPHSLASLVAHLEAYLQEVDRAGFLEPDAALWRAVDLELNGERGLWIERSAEDGPIVAGLRDLAPVRLRTLACVPGLGGASFALALRRGGASAGLFGSSQPLVEWFLDGLERHGQALPNELGLEEPEGWGAAPWTPALDGLFDAQMDLEPYQDCFQRGLVEGPADLLRHAAEQICAWLDEGIPAQDISIIHPQPQRVGPLLAPILAAEGIALQVRGGLLPLIASEAWSPLWALLDGMQRLDPCTVSAGLRISCRDDLRRWADRLAEADQTGVRAFTGSFAHLPDWARSGAKGAWKELAGLREATLHARDWAARLEALAGGLRLPMDPDDFFSPLGLLKEAWGSDLWTCAEMLTSLQAFLETARSTRVPRSPEGVRLVTPDTLLEDWPGARATLILDLSEGAWPGRHADNPDLDWDRKAAINRALLQASVAAGEVPFPPALQRFWLPRSEHGEQVPRTFQREAYAFNKVLAMTRERLLVLSPAADAEGRPLAQGPFWNALEGAAEWTPRREAVHSRLRWLWDGREQDPRAESRARSTLARSGQEALAAESPGFDRNPEARNAWHKGRPGTGPTALEVLATCPFRSLAERVWGLTSVDASSRFAMAVGSLVHRVMEEVLTPFVGLKDWPAAFLADAGAGAEVILSRLRGLWESRRDDWLRELAEDIPQEQWSEASFELEALLPNLAAALAADAVAPGPTRWEIALLLPDRMSLADAGKAQKEPPLQNGWIRTLLALEGELGPVELDLGNGRTLTVSGKMDRIERWEHAEGHAFLRVMDYKTSKKSSLKAFAEEGAPFASHLQTPLYMLIAEALLGGAATAALLPLREEEPEPFTRHLGTLAADPDWRQRLRGNLATLEARGDFPATPGEHCRRCELGALCGRPVDVTVETDVEDD
jgi:hypothetical protein